MGLSDLFRKPKSSIYSIERRDIEINKDVFALMNKAEANLKELRDAVREGNLSWKDAKLAELENNFLLLKSKVETLRGDLKMIIDLEVQNKDYVTIHDDAYLEDKYNRLSTMNDVLDELVDLLGARPGLSELRKELIDYIYGKINLLIDAINNIINDDRHLESVYSKLDYL